MKGKFNSNKYVMLYVSTYFRKLRMKDDERTLMLTSSSYYKNSGTTN